MSVALSTDFRGIATLTLNRPEKHNALSAELIDALHRAVDGIAADPAVRAVILTGAGRSFCAGGDLAWMRAQFDADRAGRMAEARRLAMMLHALNTLPKPVIARVQGPAYGGGVGMMAVADAVIAAEGARFGLTETRLGLIPATISPYVIARMGEGPARSVFMSARLFDAAEAVRLHLVTRSVPEAELDAVVEAEAAAYLACAPAAVAAAKALARSLGPRIDEAVIEDTIVRLADTWETPEAREGIAAFFGKRPAPWVG
jgi:methylglutaconyl-CoA hydratase